MRAPTFNDSVWKTGELLRRIVFGDVFLISPGLGSAALHCTGVFSDGNEIRARARVSRDSRIYRTNIMPNRDVVNNIVFYFFSLSLSHVTGRRTIANAVVIACAV